MSTPCKWLFRSEAVQGSVHAANFLSSDDCKKDFCASLCIKDELGEDDQKKGKWTTIFARAPVKSDDCLDACYSGCQNMAGDDD